MLALVAQRASEEGDRTAASRSLDHDRAGMLRLDDPAAGHANDPPPGCPHAVCLGGGGTGLAILRSLPTFALIPPN